MGDASGDNVVEFGPPREPDSDGETSSVTAYCSALTARGTSCRVTVGEQGERCSYHRGKPDADDPQAIEEHEAKKSAATVLVEMARERYEFGISDAGEPYGLPRSGPQIVRLLRGGKTSLRAQLARLYYERAGQAAPQQALADALLVLEGTAQDQAEDVLHVRAADAAGARWLDLGDGTGRAIKVEPGRWELAESTPVLFKRTALNLALPEPAEQGDLDLLWSWLNVAEHDRPLVLAWLVSVLCEHIPHPVLGLFGEQGTGKSTATKVLVNLLDPSSVPNRKPPRDADAWVTAASGSWVVGIDNLSDISDWLSDSLCRASTGDGDVRRRLYTDADLAVIAFRRCVVINGIDLGAVRGDLAERLLPITLDRITEQDRRDEATWWPRWHADHPVMLAGLLDLAASVARVIHDSPSVELANKPRMADYARLLWAVDQVLGTSGLDRYRERSREIAADAAAGDVFIEAMRQAVTEEFTGTSSQLLARVRGTQEWSRPPKGWPGNARAVTTTLRRLAPSLRSTGWVVDDLGDDNRGNVIRWCLFPPEKVRNDPPDPRNPRTEGSNREEREGGEGPYEQSQDETHTPPQLELAEPDDYLGDPFTAADYGALLGTPCNECGHRSGHAQSCEVRSP